MTNSGYKWPQIREVVISSLKSMMKKEKREEIEGVRYSTGEESLITRVRKKLLDTTDWYKKEVDRER